MRKTLVALATWLAILLAYGSAEAQSARRADQTVTVAVGAAEAAGQKYVYGALLTTGGSLALAGYIKAHPDTVQSFVNATVRALEWMHQASVDDIVAAVPAEFYGADREPLLGASPPISPR